MRGKPLAGCAGSVLYVDCIKYFREQCVALEPEKDIDNPLPDWVGSIFWVYLYIGQKCH